LEQWRGRAQELETGQAGREAQLLSHIRERESSLEDLRRRAIAFEAEAQALLRNQQQQIEQQQRLLEQMPGRERSDWEAQASALRARHKLEIQEKDAELERLRAAASEAEAGRDRAAGEAAHIVGWIQQAKAQFEQERRELLQLLDAARREAEHLRHQLDVLQARSSAATEAASAEASGDGHGAHPRALAAPWPPPSPGAPPFDLPKALQLAEYEVRALQRQMTDYEEALRERDRMIARLRGEREPHPRLY
jgi:DNA repair exonuclease SbcCD ATPase subunit